MAAGVRIRLRASTDGHLSQRDRNEFVVSSCDGHTIRSADVSAIYGHSFRKSWGFNESASPMDTAAGGDKNELAPVPPELTLRSRKRRRNTTRAGGKLLIDSRSVSRALNSC